ncbi:MAG: hypothetical protein DMG67_03245 [Acidobacteria bacterium]|nr:MAG: hypothetical protein DMG67_03245 [Acidobacteriota bacterium]
MVSLVVGVGGIPAEPGAAAALLLGLVVLVELLVLGLLLVVPCAEVSLWGVVLVPEVPVAEELVLPVAELGGVVPDEVISEELDGEVADALPGLLEVEQLEETMLALSTLKVLPLGVPVTERVWPT